MTLAAVAAIAAAAAVGVFSAAFALHAVLQPVIGAAGAAAVVAAVAALIVAIAGLLAARKAEGRHAPRAGHGAPQDSFGFAERIVDIVKDRPLLSIGAALAAGVFALKNPTLTAAVAKAFMETRQPPR